MLFCTLSSPAEGDPHLFRKLGLIEYNGGLKVNSSLLRIVLDD